MKDGRKTPTKPVYGKRKPGEKRGREMSQKNKDAIARIQSYWNEVTDATDVRLAYIGGSKLCTLKAWIARGFIIPPAPRQPEKPIPVVHRDTVFQGPTLKRPVVSSDDWDEGPVPTVESLRRQIKRLMQDLIKDPDSISKYANALARLESIKRWEKEDADSLESINATTIIYLPNETMSPHNEP